MLTTVVGRDRRDVIYENLFLKKFIRGVTVRLIDVELSSTQA